MIGGVPSPGQAAGCVPYDRPWMTKHGAAFASTDRVPELSFSGMSRTTSHILTWSCTLWVIWSLLALAPIPVYGQTPSLPSPELSFPAPGLSSVPQPAAPPLSVPGSALIGSCDTPDYWIVSSREAVQHRLKKREDWTLDVYGVTAHVVPPRANPRSERSGRSRPPRR